MLPPLSPVFSDGPTLVEQRLPLQAPRRHGPSAPLRAWWMLGIAVVCGCAGFDVPPYPAVVHDTAERTRTVQRNPLAELPWNRAARLPGRSQAEIKSELEPLWRPSLRPCTLANYSGLVATRQSQLETTPSGVFQPGTLVIDHLGQPTQVPYIAAFHRDRRLPLVVGVSGINGTVDGKFTVDILESLYRTGEFHVVHLESLTSVDHQVRNQRPFAGGFPEGVLLYETLAALRERIGHADDIDQVHLLGVSYGGLLCGVAAHCEDRFQAGILDGAVLAFSAPVDLKTLFQNLRVLRLIHDRVRDGYLAAGRDRYFRKAELGLSDRELDALDFDSYVRKIAFPYLQRVHRSLQVDFPDLPEVRDPEDVYALSSVRPFLGQLGVPLLFVHAYDDPVLSAEDHFHQVLARCPNPLVDGILLRDGGHLGFDAVCGYPFTAAVAERYFRYWSGRI